MTAVRALRGRSAIIGVGETAMAKSSELSLEELVVQSALRALEDAGLTPSDVDGIITDDEFSAVGVNGSTLAGLLGITRTYMAQAPSAGAGYAYAPLMAAQAFETGEASVILCSIGIDWGAAQAGVANFAYVGENRDRESYELPFGFVGTPVYYAMVADRYRSLYGLEESQLGAVSTTIRNHGARHPEAQRRVPVTMDDYFASPYLAEPLRLLDSCLRTTGAASFIVATPDRARSARKPPIYMLGAGFSASRTTRREFWTQRDEFPSTATGVAAQRAYLMSGLGPRDIDLAGLQDPYSIAVLSHLESCGFVPKGEAGAFVADGNITHDGSLPVNTHGGQLSHGYLASVTHIIEAVRQLRGEPLANPVDNAHTALISGLGPGDCGVLILGDEEAL